MFHGKCAYGDIEHFCPKSHPTCFDYIFSWPNLLLSCSICNDRAHKGSVLYVDAQGHILLVNPTDPNVNPADHLRFEWDEIAELASIYGTDGKGIMTVRIFDLNGLRGRKELIFERSNHLKKLFVLLKLAKQGDTTAVALLKEACQPDAPYAAFALHYIAPVLATL